MKIAERQSARSLRQFDGLPMKEIAKRLGVSVSSVSRWTHDIELTPEQVAARESRDRRSSNGVAGARRRSELAREVRSAAQEHGRQMARTGSALHETGCMLYWAEGSKSRNTVAFTNSDVDMQRCFVRFLKECYVIAPEDVRIAVNCHLGNGIDLGDIEAWWLQALALPVSSLRAASVNAPSRASRTRRNTLIYGTAKVVVNSTFVVQSIYGAIQEYVSIDRPEWLDCPQPQIDRISR